MPDSASGIDPISNEADGSAMAIPTAGQQVRLQSRITVKGGTYLFAPGLAGLARLVGPNHLQWGKPERGLLCPDPVPVLAATKE